MKIDSALFGYRFIETREGKVVATTISFCTASDWRLGEVGEVPFSTNHVWPCVHQAQVCAHSSRMNKTTNRPASTADILGIRKSPKISPEYKGHYSRLIVLREQMMSRKAHLVADAKEEQPVYSEHMGDAGTDQYDQDFALSMISSDQQSIYEIDQALDRLRNGTYGICELTGKPIEPERLEAIPWARFRFDAQKELERTGSVGFARFGKIQSIGDSSPADDDDDSDSMAD